MKEDVDVEEGARQEFPKPGDSDGMSNEFHVTFCYRQKTKSSRESNGIRRWNAIESMG